MPYAEFSAQYEFIRPNDGKIMTNTLTLEPTSPWTETLRLGTRSLVSPTTCLEASVGYLGLGHNGLDVWEGRIYVSHAF